MLRRTDFITQVHVSHTMCIKIVCHYLTVCMCVRTCISRNYFQPLTCQRRFFLKNVSELAGWLTLPKGD